MRTCGLRIYFEGLLDRELTIVYILPWQQIEKKECLTENVNLNCIQSKMEINFKINKQNYFVN